MYTGDVGMTLVHLYTCQTFPDMIFTFYMYLQFLFSMSVFSSRFSVQNFLFA